MDAEDGLEPIDILAYITEELQGSYKSAQNAEEQSFVFKDFLKRWENDPQMEKLKNMKVEFEQDLDWFNVEKPLSMNDLNGKLVILDFFTYCCINCMHILPELHALEECFSIEKGLVVLGVHSPKFENEKEGSNINSASQRYSITHPVVNDPNSKLWKALNIRCWPTLLVLSPQSVPLLLLMGEGHGEFLQKFTEVALKYFAAKSQIKNFDIKLKIEKTDSKPASKLRFPSKIARSPSGECFALADAGNNRILIFDISGRVIYRIGGVESGFVDGSLNQARFNTPQGVEFLSEYILIVADTENHAVRQVSLQNSQVETLAGTGLQGNDRIGGKFGILQAISSPWDVAVYFTRDMDMSFHVDEHQVQEKPIIIISMAGTHQIWGYFPEGVIWWKFRKFEPRTCTPIIGNGQEENRNNSYPQNAAFAQPSGMAIAKNFLFIADSESSSIRKASMLDGKVMPVVGGDRNPLNLFAFGDLDGKQYTAKLQHPLAVTYNHLDDKVYVADTYNHKIKRIDTNSNQIETLAITHNTNNQLLQFNEPAGLCFDASGQSLFISDTNNHQLQIINMSTLQAQRFELNFPQTSEVTDSASIKALQVLKRLPFNNYKTLKLNVSFSLDKDLKFTSEAPQRWSINASNSYLQAAERTGKIDESRLIKLEFERTDSGIALTQNDEHIRLELALSLCNANSCLIKRFVLMLQNENLPLGDEATEMANFADVEQNINIHISENEVTLS